MRIPTVSIPSWLIGLLPFSLTEIHFKLYAITILTIAYCHDNIVVQGITLCQEETLLFAGRKRRTLRISLSHSRGQHVQAPEEGEKESWTTPPFKYSTTLLLLSTSRS